MLDVVVVVVVICFVSAVLSPYAVLCATRFRKFAINYSSKPRDIHSSQNDILATGIKAGVRRERKMNEDAWDATGGHQFEDDSGGRIAARRRHVCPVGEPHIISGQIVVDFRFISAFIFQMNAGCYSSNIQVFEAPVAFAFCVITRFAKTQPLQQVYNRMGLWIFIYKLYAIIKDELCFVYKGC